METEIKNINKNDGKKKFRKKAFRTRRQKRMDREKNPKDDRDVFPRKNPYADIVKKNDDFENYYKQQNIIKTDDEWNEFMKILLEPLPSAFRISTFCIGQAQKLRDIIQNDYNNLKNSEEEESKDLNIFPIPWYPNKLAWTMNLSKIELRRSSTWKKFHRFLISETETGDISRQEAVSMIPPLLLDIQPGQSVLDLCAAPGSKTAQIIEMLHQESGSTFIIEDENDNNNEAIKRKPLDGLVVANDADNRRCYMLVHQSKRLHSPCVVIINHDAAALPDFYHNDNENGKTLLKFDRVLADVPCSGDGTIRKNYDCWTKWNAANSNNFHYLQSKIAKRGIELLAKDGIMAYSTCSLNPIEDEAVISSLLNSSNGGLELIDAASILPELKCSPGLETWTVMTKDNKIVSSFDEVPENLQSQIRPTLFPPKNASQLNLKYCIRILPHHQNTGGFFVALIRKKVEKLCWEKDKEENKSTTIVDEKENGKKSIEKKSDNKKKNNKFKGHREDPFFFLNKADNDWISLKSFYRFPESVSANQFAHRCLKGHRRNIYYLSKKAANFISNNPHIKLINGGARVFNRIDVKDIKCNYRITQEGISAIFPYFRDNLQEYSLQIEENNQNNDDNNPITATTTTDSDSFKIIEFDFDHFVRLLKQEDLKINELDEKYQKIIRKLPPGCCILYVKISNNENNDNNVGKKFMLPICCWKGKNSIRAYVAKNDRSHLLRLCGHEPLESINNNNDDNNNNNNNKRTLNEANGDGGGGDHDHDEKKIHLDQSSNE